jgi:hypothetical protein
LGEYLLKCMVRMKSVLKGESHLIGGVAVEVHDVSAGEVPVGRRRRVLKVHGEDEELEGALAVLLPQAVVLQEGALAVRAYLAVIAPSS